MLPPMFFGGTLKFCPFFFLSCPFNKSSVTEGWFTLTPIYTGDFGLCLKTLSTTGIKTLNDRRSFGTMPFVAHAELKKPETLCVFPVIFHTSCVAVADLPPLYTTTTQSCLTPSHQSFTHASLNQLSSNLRHLILNKVMARANKLCLSYTPL